MDFYKYVNFFKILICFAFLVPDQMKGVCKCASLVVGRDEGKNIYYVYSKFHRVNKLRLVMI